MPRSGFITPRILATDSHGIRFVHASSTHDLVLTKLESGGLFDNRGADEDVLFTLPASWEGQEFKFQVISPVYLGIRTESDNATLEFDVGGGFQPQLAGSVLSCDRPGSCITLFSRGMKSDGQEAGWTVTTVSGSWVVTSPDTSESAPEPVADIPEPAREDVPSEQVTKKKRGRPRKNQEQGRAEHAPST